MGPIRGEFLAPKVRPRKTTMTITIATSEIDTTFYTQGETLAAVIMERNPGSEVEVLASNGSVENVRNLDSGEIDFGFMASNWAAYARAPRAPFERVMEIALVAPVNTGPLYFVARADSGITTFSDLKGRILAPGRRDSGMVQHLNTIFDVLGWPVDDAELRYLNIAEGIAALRAGTIDAQFQVPIPNQHIIDLTESLDVRVVPFAEDQLDAILDQVPFYRRCTIAKGAFRGHDADVVTPGVVNVLATGTNADEARVHQVASALIEAQGELARRNPLFATLAELFDDARSQGAAVLAPGGVPLHPGAVRAFTEAGYLS